MSNKVYIVKVVSGRYDDYMEYLKIVTTNKQVAERTKEIEEDKLKRFRELKSKCHNCKMDGSLKCFDPCDERDYCFNEVFLDFNEMEEATVSIEEYELADSPDESEYNLNTIVINGHEDDNIDLRLQESLRIKKED